MILAADVASRSYRYTNDWVNLGLSLLALLAVVVIGSLIVGLSPPDRKRRARRITAGVAVVVAVASAASFVVT